MGVYKGITRRDIKNVVDYVFDYRYKIEYWKKKLGLQHLSIVTELIDRKQVMFPDDISNEDRYFIGVSLKGREAIISHDRDLTEEDILHELLHLANPDKSEEWVNKETTNRLKAKKR